MPDMNNIGNLQNSWNNTQVGNIPNNSNTANYMGALGSVGGVNHIPKNDGNEIRVIQTDLESKNGQNKCPKCGSTDISLNPRTGLLRCNFCRYEFEPEKVHGMEEDISKLQGEVMGSGAQDIVADTKDVLTFKCSSCGAEVVIDTANSTQARCHWCRNILSVNQQIPNGTIPDVVLPFKVTKDEARQKMDEFVKKRKFFANTQFKKEYSTENIMGVYFPYMLVDINTHVTLSGKGERKTREYYVRQGDNTEKRYDADLYQVNRDFDLTINDLALESNSERLKASDEKTNNIINAILPFDTENCVKYDANYLKGYTSEKRNVNVDQLRPFVEKQSRDVAKFAANDTIKEYDRGVRWEAEDLAVKGKQWETAYLPVWLYSYQEKKANKSVLHYVAVNARTKETMGSIPLNIPKLLGISVALEILGILMMAFIDSDYSWIFLLLGFLFFAIMFLRYRNLNARHHYETETKKTISNVRKSDQFIRNERNLSNNKIEGVNNNSISGNSITENFINDLSKISNNINNVTDIKKNGLDELKKMVNHDIFK